MKKLMILMVLSLFILVPSNTIFAHSHLSSTVPADGEVKNEQVQSVVLNFDGKIMEGSYVEISHQTDGIVPNVKLTIGEGMLTATPDTPLKNGDYQVNWSIISADGHPLEGSFAFKVDAPEDQVTENNETSNQEANVESQIQTKENDEPNNNDNSNLIITLIGAAILLLAVGGVFFARSKK